MGTGTFRTAGILSLVTAAIAVVAGTWTFLDPGLLHGPEAMQGSARGTALVLLTIAVPVVVVSVWRARQGSGAAVLTCGGALVYVVYNAVLFLFLTPFNAAFLVYTGLLGLALWSLGYLAAAPETWRVGESIARQAPVRAVAAYVWLVVALNSAAWLSKVVPALDDPYPTPMLAGTGEPTNAIYVQDLAIWLPLAAVAAWWLARRQARGAVVVGALLGGWVIEAVSIAADQWLGTRADPGSSVVSMAVVVPFLVIALVGLVPLWLLLRSGTASGAIGTFGPAGPGGGQPRLESAEATGRPPS